MFLRKCALSLLVTISAWFAHLDQAAAENLHLKYRQQGEPWDCSKLPDSERFKDACFICEDQGMDFDVDRVLGAGTCVEIKTPEPVEVQEVSGVADPGQKTETVNDSEKHFYFGAIAVGMWRINGKPHVESGIALNLPSSEEATENAIAECKSRGGLFCKIVGTFYNGGCGYISVGRNKTAVSFGASNSIADTLLACRNGNKYRCDEPRGGCTNKPE